MSILIGEPNNSGNVSTIRNLIMGGDKDNADFEKYQLIIDNGYSSKLVYAKGWINFDKNLIKDGSNNLIDYHNLQPDIYAFYDDGFYRYDANTEIWTSEGSNLSSFNNPTSTAAVFNGWYTEKNGGVKVNTIEDIWRRTDLFKHKSSLSIPTITLYAHWSIKTYTVYVKNITRTCFGNNYKTGRSSVWHEGRRKTGQIVLRKIPYNTEIISYINSIISNPTYITWAKDTLDKTEHQQNLRSGKLQPFLGWYTSEDGRGKVWDSYYIKTDEVSMYPQFNALVIWEVVFFPRNRIQRIDGDTTYTYEYYGGNSGYGYASKNPVLPLSYAKAREPNTFQGEGYDVSEWHYDNSYYDAGSPGIKLESLGSACTQVVTLDWSPWV